MQCVWFLEQQYSALYQLCVRRYPYKLFDALIYEVAFHALVVHHWAKQLVILTLLQRIHV
jgi:hypothetical protein